MQTTQSITDVLSAQRELKTRSRFLRITLLTICLVALIWFVSSGSWNLFTFSAVTSNADVLDARLQRAATLALGNRRGAVIVMDPQTGRVRAVVNPTLAFETELPAGSTIKPFTTLAALRSHVIDSDSRTLCGEDYSRDDFHTICSHPRDLPPLNPTDALAYSCNYYFGKVGEKLAETNFDSTLEQFGFGKPTGINAASESPGSLRRTQWRAQNALGEGDYLRATPIQLINAYATLLNGGQLFKPRLAVATGFVSETRERVDIDSSDRQLILKGLRGAIRFGTAETAHLYSLPAYVFGKTGTSTEINGYRSQGWFIGFASTLDEGRSNEAETAPENVKLAVLVFLAKAHGSDAAEAARPIFEEFAKFETENSEIQTPKAETNAPANFNATPINGCSFSGEQITRLQVRVQVSGEKGSRTMPLEDYVRGGVATEGSLEGEPEALKALAVASRTYAVKNLGRHRADGYDFCTTTHCQRFELMAAEQRVEAAVSGTAGEVLCDSANEVADSYFSASCGGATANIAALWGGSAPPHLRGVKDDSCLHEAHHDWTDVISQNDLLRALQTDPRTNVGTHLRSLTVLRRDASGRAELIALQGDRRATVKGWEFKIIVGRALGWNLLKSSRFQVTHSGVNFVFRGSGFGHGLGLCQEGAHVMAARGGSYQEILTKYFPTTRVGNGRSSADLIWRKPSPSFAVIPSSRVSSARRSLRSENFRVSYPQSVDQREVEALLKLLETSRVSLTARARAAGMAVQLPSLEIFVNETTGDFVGRTGQPAWAAAATKNQTVDLQPLATLKRRRILETTVRHELVHTLVESVGRGRAPRWLGEGLALHLAGEGRLVARYQPSSRLSVEEIDRRLAQDAASQSPDFMRAAYAAAYNEVKRIIDNEGEASVWRRVAR